MAVTSIPTVPTRFHPAHAFVLGGAVALFLGAMLSDLAYWSTYEIQWNNFASWLIAGALVVSAVAVLWALVDLFGRSYRGRAAYPALMVLTWILGFVNALVHARDGWASMPAGLILSVIVVLLACAAAWTASNRVRTGELP
ncbi:MAG: DUF2231 domain-containing protein [Lysobacter sp.]